MKSGICFLLLNSLLSLQAKEIFEKILLPQKNTPSSSEPRTLTKVEDSDGDGDVGQDGDYSGVGDKGACELFQAVQNIFEHRMIGQEVKNDSNACMCNRMWSALSTYMALSILHMGTAGNTRDQLGSLLGGGQDHHVPPYLQKWLVRTVCGKCNPKKQAKLVLTNAVLVKYTRDNIRLDFLKQMNEEGRIEKNESVSNMYHVQFKHKEAPERINDWAEETTGGMIKNMMKPGQIGSDTAMVVINLLYFNGHWKNKFSPKDTITSVFHTLGGDKTVQLMYKREEMVVGYDSALGYQWVELPYMGDKFAMVAYLPLEAGEDALKNLASILINKTACLEEQETKETKTEVMLFFPKFVMEYEEELTKKMKEKGVKDLFDLEKANFSNMIKDTKEKLAVTSIRQRLKIQVDETGTKAAAATKVIVETNRMGPGEPMKMRFDRPFIFSIVSLPDKLPFLGGLVLNPGEILEEVNDDGEIVEDMVKVDVGLNEAWPESNKTVPETGENYSEYEYDDPYDELPPPTGAGQIIPLLDQFSWCDLKRPEMKRLLNLLETCDKYNISTSECENVKHHCQHGKEENQRQGRHKCDFYIKLCENIVQLRHHCKDALEPLRSTHQKICEEIGTDVSEKVHNFWDEFSIKLKEELNKTDNFPLMEEV